MKNNLREQYWEEKNKLLTRINAEINRFEKETGTKVVCVASNYDYDALTINIFSDIDKDKK